MRDAIGASSDRVSVFVEPDSDSAGRDLPESGAFSSAGPDGDRQRGRLRRRLVRPGGEAADAVWDQRP